jgi:hypothetical protein
VPPAAAEASVPPETGPVAVAEAAPEEQSVGPSIAEVEKIADIEQYQYTGVEETSKFPLFWVLGGIAAAVGGLVLFLRGKMGKK